MTTPSKGTVARFRQAGTEGRITLLEEARALGGGIEDFALYEEGLGDPEWRVRKMAVECAIALAEKERVVGWLIGLLASGDNAGKRNSAIEAIELVGSPAIPQLLAHVSDPDPDVRKFVVDILGVIRDARSLDTLVGCLRDTDGNVRAAAAESLGNLGIEKAIEPLLALMGGGDLHLDYMILEALARIGGGAIPLEAVRSTIANPILKKVGYGVLGVIQDARGVDLLLEGLSEPSRSARDAAIGALVRRYDATRDEPIRARIRAGVKERLKLSTIRELTRMLDRMDTPQRKAIVKLMGWSGSAEATGPIVALADEPPLRADVLEALEALGENAVAALAALFPEASFSLQALVCEALGKVASEASERLLVEALGSEAPDVREAAAVALGGQGKGPVEPLFRALADEEPRVQWAALGALGRLTERFRAEVLARIPGALASAEVDLRKNAIALAGTVALEEHSEAIAFAIKDESAEVRRSAVGALANLGHGEGLDRIVLCVADESSEVRVAVAHALGRFRSERAIDSLLLMTEDESLRVGTSAIGSLGSIGNPRVLPQIYPLLRHEAGIVAICALDAVLALDKSPSRKGLREILHHREPDVVRYAVGRIAGLAGIDLFEITRDLIDHPDPAVRAKVAEALGDRGLRGASGALTDRLAAERDPEVAEKVRAALAKLRGDS